MAQKVLAVPEEHLAETITVIRAGLAATTNDESVTTETREGLSAWCDEEAAYLAHLHEAD